MSVYIIGGGVAGLAAAIGCIKRGLAVTLYESAPQLGGRCRSYRHDSFDAVLDNGAHAVLANNEAVNRYLGIIGASDRLQTNSRDGLNFVDLRDGKTWRFKLPRALWDSSSRPPETSTLDVLNGSRLMWGNPNASSVQILKATPSAIDKLWEPLCTSALNTPLAEADGRILSAVVRGMLGFSGLRLGLKLPRHSLTHTYIDPAAQWLQRKGANVRLQSPLREIIIKGGHVERLNFDHDTISIGTEDRVVLAVPPWSQLMTQAGIMTEHLKPSPIVNAHFQVVTTQASNFIGIVGGMSQWLWLRDGLATVTISAAEAHLNTDSDVIAGKIWAEIAAIFGVPNAPLPPVHVVKERRATLRHVLGINDLRATTKSHLANLILAGDWVKSGMPCTLESAIQSGFKAAALAVRPLRRF